MFRDIQGRAKRSENHFSEQVHDRTGKEIMQDVYNPLNSELCNMQTASDEKQEKTIEINALLAKLRAIV